MWSNLKIEYKSLMNSMQVLASRIIKQMDKEGSVYKNKKIWLK